MRHHHLYNKKLREDRESPDFAPNKYLIKPEIYRSKKWMLQRIAFRYISLLPGTGVTKYDEMWMDFIVKEMRKAHHIKKRKLSTFWKTITGRYFIEQVKINNIANADGVANSFMITNNVLGNVFEREELAKIVDLMDRMKCHCYDHDDTGVFRTQFDDPQHTCYNRVYWDDLKSFSIEAARVVANIPKGEESNVREEKIANV
jgi:hypothetical protein